MIKLKKMLNESQDTLTIKSDELPFLEEQISVNEYIRTFDQNVDENELKWHIDGEDRIVESLHPTDWMLQLDNELPKKIEGKIHIKEGQYHRIIRGNGELKLKIVKY